MEISLGLFLLFPSVGTTMALHLSSVLLLGCGTARLFASRSVLHSIHVKIAIAELLGAATCAVFKRKSSTAAFSLRQQRARKQSRIQIVLQILYPFLHLICKIRIPFTKRFAMKHHSSNAHGILCCEPVRGYCTSRACNR